MPQLEHPMISQIIRTGYPMEVKEVKKYKAKISAVVEITAWVKELPNGEVEIEEVDEILEVEEFENIREI